MSCLEEQHNCATCLANDKLLENSQTRRKSGVKGDDCVILGSGNDQISALLVSLGHFALSYRLSAASYLISEESITTFRGAEISQS